MKVNEGRKEYDSAEGVYNAIIACVLINGVNFKSVGDVEKDLELRDKVLSEVKMDGFDGGFYKSLNDVEKKLYIILHGYDLSLIFDYLVNKAVEKLSFRE